MFNPSTVSPKMFKEFEVDYASRLCARFGLVYYGCCDPLDRKMAEVRLIPNVRKVSMSAWVDQERGAAEIGISFISPGFAEALAACRELCIFRLPQPNEDSRRGQPGTQPLAECPGGDG